MFSLLMQNGISYRIHYFQYSRQIDNVIEDIKTLKDINSVESHVLIILTMA